ncbi:hypothetical protein HYFRA_00012274 [Hymenoscyphus fraxineus]|uniref:F-box domain-containing protein n=1 Tax=Hymenoscyphus fraxineus TaxID=746836 RepID=A0A9N9L2W7_9HELO|nr:hypothetical protein HYFRA_00012274 [Hymenoscyphus fraxineus]
MFTLLEGTQKQARDAKASDIEPTSTELVTGTSAELKVMASTTERDIIQPLNDERAMITKQLTTNNHTNKEKNLEYRSLDTLPEEILLQIIKLLHPVESICLALMSTKLYRIHRKVHGVVKMNTKYPFAGPGKPSDGELSDILEDCMEEWGFTWVVWAREGSAYHGPDHHHRASAKCKMNEDRPFVDFYPGFYVTHADSKHWPVNKEIPKPNIGQFTRCVSSVVMKDHIYLDHIGKKRPRYHWNDYREAGYRVSRAVIHHVGGEARGQREEGRGGGINERR